MATVLDLAHWQTAIDGATEIVPPHPVSDEVLLALGVRYEPLAVERFDDGTLLVTPPTGGTGSLRNVRLTSQLAGWAEATGAGFVFGPDGGFRFPGGAMLAPDATYVARERWLALSQAERETFARIVPDAVFELLSPSDRIASTRRKIRTYLRHGVRLAVLIDPFARRISTGSADDPNVQQLGDTMALDCSPVMPGFVLDVAAIVRAP